MTRRPILSLLLLVALAVAGCGGDEGGGSGGSLDDSLGYLPKNAPVVVTADTDLDGEQYKNLDAMLKKFPFTGQLKSQIKQSAAEGGVDYEKDVKPILGNELVVGLPDPRGVVDDAAEDKYVLVFPADGGKLKSLMEKDRSQRKSGKIDGADVYESGDGSALVVRGDTLVGASTRAELEAAIERHDGDDKLTEADFNAPFEGLPADAPMRVYGDMQALLVADPDTAEARRVKWVNGLRKFAFTATAQKDGVALDGRLITEGLTPEDLPLAAGDQAAPVARFGDFAVGQRDVGHTTDWILDIAAKSEGEDYAAEKRKLGKALGGIDIDRDLIDQFSGNSTLAGQLDGTVALRSDVKDPDAMRATLDKIAKSKGRNDLRITKAGGLLKATDEDGEELYFGMEGDVFVGSQESPARAKALARVEPQPVPGAKGALVFAADGETIAKQAIRQSGQNQAAGLFTGPLSDVTAWVSAAPEGMRINAKLKVE
jgi:hypothetical protein